MFILFEVLWWVVIMGLFAAYVWMDVLYPLITGRPTFTMFKQTPFRELEKQAMEQRQRKDELMMEKMVVDLQNEVEQLRAQLHPDQHQQQDSVAAVDGVSSTDDNDVAKFHP
jgi:hypothetical protein